MKTIRSVHVIPRSEHPISRSLINANALKVLYRLKDAGHESYLVGGCVRDLLLGREPKDFDVVTDAPPEEIRRLFRNARLVGRRFRLAHVRFGREIVEVATFRANLPAEAAVGDQAISEDGRILRDNIFGTQEEDALRRDFTVNALYYNIRDFSVSDYVGGYEDLRSGIIRVIGDPPLRFREDPVRMLRAVRFSAKLGLKLEPSTERPLLELGHLLRDVPPARMFEEVLKLFHGGAALSTFELLRHYDLFQHVFPLTDAGLAQEHDGFPLTLVPQALANTDARINEGKSVTPAFLFAVMLWEPVQWRARAYADQGLPRHEAMRLAAGEVLAEQQQHTSIPRRFSTPMREIWQLQGRFTRRNGHQAQRLLEHERFRAAYDFLCLRSQVGEESPDLCEWWTRFQDADAATARGMVDALNPGAGGRKTRRAPRRRKANRERH